MHIDGVVHVICIHPVIVAGKWFVFHFTPLLLAWFEKIKGLWRETRDLLSLWRKLIPFGADYAPGNLKTHRGGQWTYWTNSEAQSTGQIAFFNKILQKKKKKNAKIIDSDLLFKMRSIKPTHSWIWLSLGFFIFLIIIFIFGFLQA